MSSASPLTIVTYHYVRPIAGSRYPTLKGLEMASRVMELRAQLLGLYAPQRHHLVDETGNTIDITRLMPVLRRFGLGAEDD